MKTLERIPAQSQIDHGGAQIKGTRVSVILDNLVKGLSREAILESYPYLQPEDIDAILDYAFSLAEERGVTKEELH